MIRRCAALLWVALAARTGAHAEIRPRRLLEVLERHVQPQRAVHHVEELYRRDRWFTFPKFHETARYLEGVLRQAGLRDVERLGAPADGRTQVGFWTLPLAWDVQQARLEVIEPSPPAEFKVLCDYQQVPQALCMWSGPTPPEGVVAEVVDTGDAGAGELPANLKGKVVLTSRNPAELKWLFAQRGAVGVINAYTENPALVDGRQWVNAWGDKGWAFTQGDSPLFCFSITPRQAKWLREQLAAGRAVRVRALVNSRYYVDTYPYVTAVLPGEPGDEEVLALGHTSEPGAQDNATGVAAMIEAFTTLAELIDKRLLPRPRRSIRLLAMPEIYGSLHYIQTRPERAHRTVAAICLDTPAGHYELSGTEYTFYLNPYVAASFVDAVILKLAGLYFPRLKPARPFHEKPYMMGTDTYLGDPMIGIPTVWPYSGSGVHTHHNSEDKPQDVDPRSLRDLTVITAAFLYTVAAATDDDGPWLGEVTLSRAYREVTRIVEEWIDQAAASNELWKLRRLLRDGLEKIDFLEERHRQAIQSVERVAPRFEPTRYISRLGHFCQEQKQRLREHATQLASVRGWPAPVPPAPPEMDERLRQAQTLIVKRKRIDSIPLDDLPVPEREGWPSAAWDTRLATALYWCDGRRSLAEVVRRTWLELGHDDFDWVGYFRFLARKGYVELEQASSATK